MKKPQSPGGRQRTGTNSNESKLESRLTEAAAQERTRGRSGRVMLYLGPDLHQRFKAFCEGRGVSMNKAATLAIEAMMEQFGD